MTLFEPFVMERMMSKFEHAVDYNLSESGVHPVRLDELLGDEPGELEKMLATGLDYAHANGTPQLRENIARLYPGADASNVLVTVGAIEANYISMLTVLSPGDEVVIMLPTYMQVWGVARNLQLTVRTFSLQEHLGWAPDLDELRDAVTPKTKLIAVCNPNNPSGYILTESEMDAIIAEADRVGAWILADEVYAGAERIQEEEAPTFYGRYEKVMAVGSLSKAYGLPGLRIGWVVAPAATMDEIWSRHEYVTLSASILSNQLAALALSPQVRPRIIARTRAYIRDGFPVLERWMGSHEGVFHFTPPQAAAIAFVRYNMDINSTEFTERVRRDKSVLIVPGDHFGMDGCVRISYGLPHDILQPALDRISEVIDELRA